MLTIYFLATFLLLLALPLEGLLVNHSTNSATSWNPHSGHLNPILCPGLQVSGRYYYFRSYRSIHPSSKVNTEHMSGQQLHRGDFTEVKLARLLTTRSNDSKRNKCSLLLPPLGGKMQTLNLPWQGTTGSILREKLVPQIPLFALSPSIKILTLNCEGVSSILKSEEAEIPSSRVSRNTFWNSSISGKLPKSDSI